MRSVVVLPAPLGPRKPVTDPGSTVKLRSSTARTVPKVLVSPVTSTRTGSRRRRWERCARGDDALLGVRQLAAHPTAPGPARRTVPERSPVSHRSVVVAAGSAGVAGHLQSGDDSREIGSGRRGCLSHGGRRHGRLGLLAAGRRAGRRPGRRLRRHAGHRLRLPADRDRRPGALPRPGRARRRGLPGRGLLAGGGECAGGRPGRRPAPVRCARAVAGSPVEVLLDVVRREQADLLVVGNRGLNGIKGRLLGRCRPMRRAGRPATSSSSTPPADAAVAHGRAQQATGARDALERLLLGGPRRWTRHEVAGMAGMPPARTQRLWRALGFPDVADDDRCSPTPTSTR